MTRKKTPDILGDILGNNETSSESTNTEIKEYNKEYNNVEKTKTTFYISQHAIDNLEEAWFTLRKIAKNNKTKISKSIIVETSIKMMLTDLKSNEYQSKIVRQLIE